MKLVLVAPVAFVPLTIHWYRGEVPPFIAWAVNMAVLPSQTGLDAVAMLTLTGKFGWTIMVNVFELAGLPETQTWLEVSRQTTTSP